MAEKKLPVTIIIPEEVPQELRETVKLIAYNIPRGQG